MLRVPERGSLTIDTEVLVSEGERGRVDLELRIGDESGNLKTVWIEARRLLASNSGSAGRGPNTSWCITDEL